MDEVKALLAALPADLPAVVLVVLHRPSDGPSYLKEVLSRASQMPVLVAEDDERFRVGYCYIDAHLSLAAKSDLRLVEGADQKHRDRTVDAGLASCCPARLTTDAEGWLLLHTPVERPWCSPRREWLSMECGERGGL